MQLERYTELALTCWPDGDALTGRRQIFTNAVAITADNVQAVLSDALAVHRVNAGEITYLWNYYKGKQDIAKKVKIVRENINNKVTVNRANQIVAFKTAFLLSEDLQYVSRGGDERTSAAVAKLNDYMVMEDKASKDAEIVDWMHICGVAERLCLTDEIAPDDPDGAPFAVYTLDPRDAFVIYSSRVGHKPMAGVILQTDADGKHFATVYTKDSIFDVYDDSVTASGNPLKAIPLVEYPNNNARMGAFEGVVSLLNSINQIESDAIDSVQDFVNGFDVFQNCEPESGTYSQLSIGGQCVLVKTVTPGMEAKVYRIASELSQSGVQQRVDDLTDAYIEICGLPNRNGGYSTSDTGTAVLYRDGWSEAASRAKSTETMFRRSEREFDRIVLSICKTRGVLDLKISDFDLAFPRGNLSNMQSKVQVFCELLNNPKVHPKYAFTLPGLFDDAEEAYRVSEEYYNQYLAEQEAKLDKEIETARNEAARNDTPESDNTDEQSDTDLSGG